MHSHEEQKHTRTGKGKGKGKQKQLGWREGELRSGGEGVVLRVEKSAEAPCSPVLHLGKTVVTIFRFGHYNGPIRQLVWSHVYGIAMVQPGRFRSKNPRGV